jgi:hypothetical protein
MTTLLGNPTVFDHYDAIGINNSSKPMCYNKRGAALREFSKRLLDGALRLSVERRCCFIKD